MTCRGARLCAIMTYAERLRCGSQINETLYLISICGHQHRNIVGVWRSLVARTLGVGEAVGSNPATPIARKIESLS